MMAMRCKDLVVWLAIGIAGAVPAGCGGGSSVPTTQPSPSPTISSLVSGGQFVASGSRGVTFTFTIGSGVPAGESAAVTPLPPSPACVGTGCTAVQPPLDGFQLSVGPQPISVGALTSVVLVGVQSPFLLSLSVMDTADGSAFPNSASLPPTGGPIAFTAPVTVHPIVTLAPNHTYAIVIYSTGIVPP
jgi:hypothetical protein